jgi:hypothetical protein
VCSAETEIIEAIIPTPASIPPCVIRSTFCNFVKGV